MSNTETAEPVTITAATRTLTIATMHSVADSFARVPHALIPQSIDMVRHDATLAQFIAFADEHGARIRFPNARPDSKARWVTAILATRELHGVEVKMTLFVDEQFVTEAEDQAFRTHNNECVVTS